MRIQIGIDSADTEQARALLASYSRVSGDKDCTARCDGPEKWNIQTPPMSQNEGEACARRFIAKLDALSGRDECGAGGGTGP